MSVQTEIDRIITAVQAAHEKVAEKGGTTTQPYLVGNLASAIDTIPNATEPVLQTKTVTPTTAKQTIKPDSGYDGLSQVDVNAMPKATQATPSISVNSSGLITASAIQSAGYVEAGTKINTKQLTTQAAQTITPSTSNKTIASGRYLTGTQTIKGDANLLAENIKSGVSIFGITGTHEGGTTPTGTLNITANGTYDVANYASANVNVASSGGCEIRTGTISFTGGTFTSFASGELVCSITGLDIRPKAVFIQPYSTFKLTSTTKNYFVSSSYSDNETSGWRIYNGTITSFNNILVRTTITEDGFELYTGDFKSLDFAQQYRYMVVGG